jgi:hypothetical protein
VGGLGCPGSQARLERFFLAGGIARRCLEGAVATLQCATHNPYTAAPRLTGC